MTGMALPASSALALATTLVATPALIARTTPLHYLGAASRPPAAGRPSPMTSLGWSGIALAFSAMVVLVDLRMDLIPPPIVQLLTILAVTLASMFIASIPDRDRPRLESRLALRLLAGAILWQAGVRIELTGRPSADLGITALWTAAVGTAFELDRRVSATLLILSATASAALMGLAVLLERAFVAPFAGAVTGLTLGMVAVVRRRGQADTPIEAGAAISVLLAALGILSMSTVPLDEPVHQAVMVLAVSVALLPALAAAVATAIDRLRTAPSAFTPRADDLIARLRSLGVGTVGATTGIAAAGAIHGAVTIAAPFIPSAVLAASAAMLLLVDATTLQQVHRRSGAPDGTVPGQKVPKRHRRVHPLDWGRIDHRLLRPGRWVRRSALVWSRRGTLLPRHLMRTRVARIPTSASRLGAIRTWLVSFSTRQQALIDRDATDEFQHGADVVVASRGHERLLYIDTRARTVLHRSEHAIAAAEDLRRRAEVFQYLRGPEVLSSPDEQSVLEELVAGRHLADVDDATRLLALASLLLDVTALVGATSRPPSPAYVARISADLRAVEPLQGFRTVTAPSTASLDNVLVTPRCEVAWIEPLPLAECPFHLPWFAIATRVAGLSPGVAQALTDGVLDRALDNLLRLGGCTRAGEERPLDLMRRLPAVRLRGRSGQSSGR
jgi:hypothetical protein